MGRKNLLEIFATHPVAMNILMVAFLVIGGYVTTNINVQFFPEIKLDYVSVRTIWTGASAEDIEISVTNRLELELKNVNYLKTITSDSKYAVSTIWLEFVPGTNITNAKDEVQRIVTTIVPDLPTDIETPVVQELERTELIANLIISGNSIDQLRVIANEYKDELHERGIEKISISGLPEEEIAIQVPGKNLQDLGLSLDQIGQMVQSHSSDTSSGIYGRDDAAREMRFSDQRRNELSFEDIPLVIDREGRNVVLGDVAKIERRAKSDQIFLSYQGNPTVQLTLQEQGTTHTLKSSGILNSWLAEKKHYLPPGIKLAVYADQAVPLRDRFKVLINNGLVGLVLVLMVLYLFLNVRLALWVAVGIPIALLGALTMLYLSGGTLNMITMFGFIMTLGIIVDDAIVVGEEALTQFTQSNSPDDAACGASQRMFLPIVAASLTTIFAFMPVILASGIIGVVLGNIAIVVVFVVATSLIEAFFILPGHLRHSFEGIRKRSGTVKPAFVDRYFVVFRERFYRKTVTVAINNPLYTIAIGVSILIFTFALFASGRIEYTFFPTPELDSVHANIKFTAGTPRSTVDEYLYQIENAVYETEEELGGNLVDTSLVQHGANYIDSSVAVGAVGSNVGAVIVDLVPSDSREVRTHEFLQRWRSKVQDAPGLESAIVSTPSVGPPGSDIEIEFSSTNKVEAKRAAVALIEYLKTIPGVYAILDDTSYGNQQQILTLTPLGKVLGLSVAEVSRQIRASIEGKNIQSFTTTYQDLEVNVTLPNEEISQLDQLDNLQIILSDGSHVPLLDVVNIESLRGFSLLRHSNGIFTVTVKANVDETVANAADILSHLETDIRPQFEESYHVKWGVGANLEDQAATEESMKTGALIALTLIYLTLAWIFGSYIWPVFVMLSIPFGTVGAAWGHLLLGYSFSIITILGLIGLSGIVVNNAIVLVVFYKQLRQNNLKVKEAMIEAGCQRLRAILLSSLTTIVGLLPLLFEKSTQAQFLIPMAITLIFGLAFSALLTLYFVPSVLALYDSIVEKYFKAEVSENLVATASD